MFARAFNRAKNINLSRVVGKGMDARKAIKKNKFNQQSILSTSIGNRVMPTGYNDKSMITKLAHGGGQKLLSGASTFANFSTKAFISNPVSQTAQFAVGATAMASVAMMSGGMAKMDQIMQQRYMRDSRYSSKLLSQTNVGRSAGNGSLNLGNHTGLSLSLSNARHG